MVGRISTLAAVSALLPLLEISSASAETVNARYAITLIGLPFGSATVNSTLEPGGYSLELSAKMTGLGSLVSSARGAATATGTFVDNRVRPATYATSSANSDLTRTTRMTMSAGNVDQVEITPPWGPYPDRVPLTPADERGVIDPMSSLVLTVPGTDDTIGPAACNRTIPIFDGATRFDVELTFTGIRKVKTKGYAGPAAICAVRYRPIAGHRANKANTRFMADNKQIEAWLVPVGHSRVVAPYRISLATMIGTIVIEATQFEVADSGHALNTTR